MNTLARLVLVLAVLPLAAHAWNGATKIPRPTIIGEPSPEVTRKALLVRRKLVEQMHFWRDRGLPEPRALDAFVVFANAAQVPVIDVLRALNPEVTDIRAEVDSQFAKFEASAVSRYLHARGSKSIAGVKISPRRLRKQLFDLYCLNRFGFAVSGTYDAIKHGRALGQTKPFALLPSIENALFARKFSVDVDKIFKPGEGPATATAAYESINLKAIGKLLGEAPRQRRIVLLPRATEGEGADDLDEISALNDVTVALHENGHFINSTLAEDPRVFGRTLEEIFADYLAAAPLDTPLIGADFAAASAAIANRLRARPVDSAAQARHRLMLDQHAARGFVRNMNEPATMDSIARGTFGADDYHAGDPGRSFLWSVRAQLEGSARERFDALAMKVIADLGRLPHYSEDMTGSRMLGGMFVRARAQDAMSAMYKAYFFWRDGERARRLVRDAKKHLLRRARESKHKSVRPSGTWRAQVRREAARAIDKDGFNLELAAATWTLETMASWEAWFRRLRENSLITLRTARPAQPADYILPELFRSYYRHARASDPDLVPVIVAEAERVMVARAVEVELKDGDRELAFLRGPHLPTPGLLMPRLRRHFNRMKSFRAQYDAANARGDQGEAQTLAGFFQRRLRQVQNFERTGHLVQLYKPHPLDWLANALIALAESLRDPTECSTAVVRCEDRLVN